MSCFARHKQNFVLDASLYCNHWMSWCYGNRCNFIDLPETFLIEDCFLMIDDSTLVWDLEQANKISQKFSTSLDPIEIASLATEGLMEHFDCAFTRIWLVEPDQKMLKLVASSGLYTHTDGSFSRIPMGAFKIGRIAQNRVSLLSNHLADESWVSDPEWAIANNINGFAGYPLANSDRVIGVLAVFSHRPLSTEFLKILSSLCTTLTVALELAARHQQAQTSPIKSNTALVDLVLSDSLAHILGQTTLTVVGTERHLDLSQIQIYLKAAEILKTLDCSYCRLTYGDANVSLDAIAAVDLSNQDQQQWETSTFGHLSFITSCFGGILKISTEESIKAIQFSLSFPTVISRSAFSLRIQCSAPLLQAGFTQLAYAAGLDVCASDNRAIPLLTDQATRLESSDCVLWVNPTATTNPTGIKAQIELSITSGQLREAVEQVIQGKTWGLNHHQTQQKLSAREQDVMALLVKGLRDRDIADQLYISDSTVKFHINNIVAKLDAKTQLQALYNLMQIDHINI